MIIKRARRLRTTQVMRDMAAETVVDTRKLIMPYFICEGKNVRDGISSMPGIERTSLENFMRDLESDYKSGVKSALLFGIPDAKDSTGSEAYNGNGIVQQAIRAAKKELPEMQIITDVCLCEYTDHGHCGIISEGKVLNDPTLVLLAKTALSHAEAGADVVAPSDMMDGRVSSIRTMLDENGFTETAIMAYSAKYASSFYGPFREAAGSAPQFGDRKSYQMDYRNSDEALKEVISDIEEGADIVMVKPALSYLDIIQRVNGISELPLCAYNVSGEYTMVKCAAQAGFIDEEKMVKEIVTSMFRAGSNMVISYHTRDILAKRWFD